MTDTSVQKIDSANSPKGQLGQKYLASGKSVSMRLWENEEPNEAKESATRKYETVGYLTLPGVNARGFLAQRNHLN